MNKSKGVYKCLVCLSKRIQLHREFGTWPTDQFKALSVQEQTDFMKAVGETTGQADLSKVANSQMERYSKKANYYVHGGEFLPLDVWANRGFDAARIRDNSATADKMIHPVLGDVYRVATLSSGSKGEQGDMTSHVVGTRSRASRRDTDSEDSDVSMRTKAKNAEKKAKAKAKKEADRKRKVDQKENYARKAEETAAAAEQKAQDGAKRRRVADAKKVEAKLTDIVSSNQETMALPGTLLLPAIVVEQARAKFIKAEETLKIAQLVMEGTAGEQSVPDMKVVKADAQHAQKAETMLKNLIGSMVRFHSNLAGVAE